MAYRDINTQIATKIARLEVINDHLETELHRLDELLRAVGFDDGIESLKTASAELLEMA
jgi:hypothetical protein